LFWKKEWGSSTDDQENRLERDKSALGVQVEENRGKKLQEGV
jgi:hypothetical protein